MENNMKTFAEIYESVNHKGNFKSSNGVFGDVKEIGSSTTTLTFKKSNGGYDSVDVHNSKLYIQTGKYKGKTVQDLYDNDYDSLKKLLK